MTVCMDDLVEHLAAAGHAPKTISDYSREVRYALEWFADREADLEEATPTQVAEYAATRPNTPGVRAHLRSGLRAWAEAKDLHTFPWTAVRVPKPPPMVCKAIEDDEAARMVTAAEFIGWRAGTAVIIGFSWGLRNQELAGLRWDWFDRVADWCRVTGKGNRQRLLPVTDPVRRALADAPREGPYVFCGRFGGHVTGSTINNWVRQVAEVAGVRPIAPHIMRHTALATANDATGDLRAVQEFAGHSRPETTAGYTRATRARLLRVATSIDYLGAQYREAV